MNKFARMAGQAFDYADSAFWKIRGLGETICDDELLKDDEETFDKVYAFEDKLNAIMDELEELIDYLEELEV